MATVQQAETEPRAGQIRFDGFISYSHAADELLAPRLQAALILIVPCDGRVGRIKSYMNICCDGVQPLSTSSIGITDSNPSARTANLCIPLAKHECITLTISDVLHAFGGRLHENAVRIRLRTGRS